eukprot:Tbor_TRINITY_DN7443_c0_g1::TRINITY_DN7443_c0_g1_i1::g.14538::m.14538
MTDIPPSPVTSADVQRDHTVVKTERDNNIYTTRHITLEPDGLHGGISGSADVAGASSSSPRLRAQPIKEFLLHRSNTVAVVLSVVSIIILVGSWWASIIYENGGRLHRRHIICFISFILQISTTLFLLLALRLDPNIVVFYILQLMAVVTLSLTALSLGINNVMVDICAQGNKGDVKILCVAHVTELIALVFICIAMMLVYWATQQRIAVLVDRGVLLGIRGRMTQL